MTSQSVMVLARQDDSKDTPQPTREAHIQVEGCRWNRLDELTFSWEGQNLWGLRLTFILYRRIMPL